MRKLLLLCAPVVLVLVIIGGLLLNSKNNMPSVEEPTQEEADHLAWCDSIYHQNVGCPKHGQIAIPPSVLARQEADHLAWCEKIDHCNVSCPNFNLARCEVRWKS